MSYEAIRWALEQPVAKSSAKFVLVAMANCVNGEGAEMLCWPSVKHLSEATGQDRKTVLHGLQQLRDWGYIRDTLERKGVTAQVVVYELKSPENGTVKQTGEQHYTYRLTDPPTGEFYIGVRSCFGDPAKDTQYKGSGRWCYLRTSADAKLTKEILGTHPSRAAAEEAERGLIAANFSNPKCMNRANSPESGTASDGNQTVPDFPSNSTVFPSKQSQISLETVPKTGHGTSKEPVKNQEGTRKRRSGFDASVVDLPEWLDREDWVRWCKDRKARGKGITEDAARLQLKNLGQYRTQGFTPTEVIEHSIANGYQGLFPPKRQTAAKPPTSSRHRGFRDLDYEEGLTNGIPDA